MLASHYEITTLLGPRGRDALAREALRCHAGAEVWRLQYGSEERGGPARWLETAPGGPALRAFYTSTHVLSVLQRLTGLGWRPSGEDGSFSYYRQAGHFLGLHRDVEECELALITCLYEDGAPADGESGVLQLWPERAGERLADIAADPEPGRVAVRLRPGQSIALLGGVVPHRLTATSPGHIRIAAPLCYVPQRERTRPVARMLAVPPRDSKRVRCRAVERALAF